MIEVDRLASATVEVERFSGHAVDVPREPHRHDYHELFWTRSGSGHHLIDGERVPVRPGAVTIVGRGQVHVFERVTGLHGAVVRFGDELLHAGPSARADPGWLLARRGSRTIEVPPAESAAIEALVAALHAESDRAPEPRGAEIARHLVLTLLLWLERWYDASEGEHDDADTALFRRFSNVLERDFARHHEARHYAVALAVPQPVLTRALRALTGSGLKARIADRVLLEGASAATASLRPSTGASAEKSIHRRARAIPVGRRLIDADGRVRRSPAFRTRTRAAARRPLVGRPALPGHVPPRAPAAQRGPGRIGVGDAADADRVPRRARARAAAGGAAE